jgi:dTMP kinase
VRKVYAAPNACESPQRAGIPVLPLREPGGTPVGDKIREILLDPRARFFRRAKRFSSWHRGQSLWGGSAPALKRGDIVLMDRFFLSTYAYQVAAAD